MVRPSRPWCLLAGISSYLVLVCFVVRFGCLSPLLYSRTSVPSLWPCWIYLYIGIFSCRLYGLLLPLVTIMLPLIHSCRSCGRPIVRSSLCGLLWLYCVPVVGVVVALVACRACYPWRAYHGPRRPPWVPSGGRPTGGGDFSKRGERQTETNPVPIFMRKVKKNVVFQRKTGEKRGEFEEKESKGKGKEEKEKGCCCVILGG